MTDVNEPYFSMRRMVRVLRPRFVNTFTALMLDRKRTAMSLLSVMPMLSGKFETVVLNNKKSNVGNNDLVFAAFFILLL